MVQRNTTTTTATASVRVRAPSTSSLSHSLRIASSNPALVKLLSRLSRPSLIDLVLSTWLAPKFAHSVLARPHLSGGHSSSTSTETASAGGDSDDDGDDDDIVNPYPACSSIQDVRAVYLDFHSRKGGKRELIDRILEGDWRHGLSLWQLATVDMRYVEEHASTGQRWTAFRLERVNMSSADDGGGEDDDDGYGHVPGDEDDSSDFNDTLDVPFIQRVHASTFIYALQREISGLAKAHYYIHTSATLSLTFVRILVVNSPYNQPIQNSNIYTDSSRLIYLAFPHGAPFVYSSIAIPPSSFSNQSAAAVKPSTFPADTRSLQRLMRDAIPRALSRPCERYKLLPTSLTTKNLHALLALRGSGRGNEANGAFSIFSDGAAETGPLEIAKRSEALFNRDDEEENAKTTATEEETGASKRRKLMVAKRFGTSGKEHRPMTTATTTATASTTSTTEASLQDPEPVADQNQASPVDNTGPSLSRLEIHLLDGPAPTTSASRRSVRPRQDITPAALSLAFNGTDVIAGLRSLAENGVVDPARMPSWMTGEAGVSSAVVRDGRRVR